MSAKIKARLKKLLAQEKGAVVRERGPAGPWPGLSAALPGGHGEPGFPGQLPAAHDTSGLHCERAFLPAPEDWEEYRRTGTPILSLESQRPLKDFAALAFSISFEADYPYVLQILAGAGVPLLAADARPRRPSGNSRRGGQTFSNPEPLAPFVDAFFLGEGEAGAVPFFQFLAGARPGADRLYPFRNWRKPTRDLRARRLPAATTTRMATLAALEPEPGFPARVTAPHLAELAPYPTHSHILAPQSEWGEMFLRRRRPRLLPGLPLLRRGLRLPSAPGAPPGGAVDPNPGGTHGREAQGGPGGGRGLGPPGGQGKAARKILAAGGDIGIKVRTPNPVLR